MVDIFWFTNIHKDYWIRQVKSVNNYYLTVFLCLIDT